MGSFGECFEDFFWVLLESEPKDEREKKKENGSKKKKRKKKKKEKTRMRERKKRTRIGLEKANEGMLKVPKKGVGVNMPEKYANVLFYLYKKELAVYTLVCLLSHALLVVHSNLLMDGAC